MKQLRAINKRNQQEYEYEDDDDEPVFVREVNVPVGMIIAGFTGAIEGLLAYLFLLNLNEAEVLAVNPRPWPLVGAGVAFRFWRTIDNFLRK